MAGCGLGFGEGDSPGVAGDAEFLLSMLAAGVVTTDCCCWSLSRGGHRVTFVSSRCSSRGGLFECSIDNKI